MVLRRCLGKNSLARFGEENSITSFFFCRFGVSGSEEGVGAAMLP